MSLLDTSTTDVVQVWLVAAMAAVEVKCRVQSTAAPAAGDGQAAVLQYRVVARSWPVGVTERVVWDARDWDVEGEPYRSHGSEATRHVTVPLQPRDVEDVTVLTPGAATDAYGNVGPNWGTASSVTVKGQVVPVGTDEEGPDGGRRQVTDQYRVWLPAGTAVVAGSRLQWRGLLLEVVGDPQVTPGVARPRPVEVRARLVRG